MKEFGIESSCQFFAALAPRRFGKSAAVAMFVAAYIVAVVGSNTAIFSTGKRASCWLLNDIKGYLESIPFANFVIERSNQGGCA